MVIASFSCVKYLLTDWNGPLDGSFYQLFISKSQIEDIEVIAIIDGAHIWDIVDEMMGEDMSMTLDNGIDSSLGQCVYKFAYLSVLITVLSLIGVGFPYAISWANIAKISLMGQ